LPQQAAGLLPEAAGLLPEAAGLLPEAAGLLPEAAGLLPEAARASCPVTAGLLPVTPIVPAAPEITLGGVGALPLTFTSEQRSAFLALKNLGMGNAKACLLCGTTTLNLRATFDLDPAFAAQVRDLEDSKIETCKEVMLAAATNDVPDSEKLPYAVRYGLAKGIIDQTHSHRVDLIKLGIERKRLAQSLTAIQNNIRISHSVPHGLGGTPGDISSEYDDDKKMMMNLGRLNDHEIVEYNRLFACVHSGANMSTEDMCKYVILQQKISSPSPDINTSKSVLHQQQKQPSEPIITIESVEDLYAQTGTSQEDTDHKSRSEKISKSGLRVRGDGANGNGKHT
jgi:hypothetical protein